MAKCDICSILENREQFKFIYEDDTCFAILHESPAVPGHSLVIPKKHFTIIEECDDNAVEHLFVVANRISNTLFSTLSAHGTNIIVNNGIEAGQELPHLIINVLPRKENDGLNLEWQGRQAADTELKTTQSMMRTFSDAIYSGREKKSEVKVVSGHREEEKQEKANEEDYQIKSLTRIP